MQNVIIIFLFRKIKLVLDLNLFRTNNDKSYYIIHYLYNQSFLKDVLKREYNIIVRLGLGTLGFWYLYFR